MTNRIDEDHQYFHDVYAGKKREALRKYQNDGSLWGRRPDGSKLPIKIPRIDIPHITYGEVPEGVGRGEVGDGDVVGQDPQPGEDGGGQAGEGEAEGIEVAVDMEEVMEHFRENLKLPDLKPKPNDIFEDEEIKYNDISLIGPESLLHKPKTLKQTLKRQCSDGSIFEKKIIPGMQVPMRILQPIQSDKRFRQYSIIQKPASNAVVFFARDWSGSMDAERCDLVSDICFWIDTWISRFYKRVEKVYVGHDTVAQEVSEDKFYKYRYGGGTKCSSALKFIDKQFESRFPPSKWNVYILYFSDGDNWGNDSKDFCDIIKHKFTPEVANLVSVCQILPWNGTGLREYVEKEIGSLENLRTSGITSKEDKNKQIKQVFIDILGDKQPMKGAGI